jgi:hypothetical protein
LLDNGHFDAALSFNEFLLSSTDKMQKRLDVDLSEDEILKKYILEINRDIKEINIKIAKQIEQTAISREYIILAEHQNINPKIKWIESREKLLETIRKEQCITRKPSHSIESLAFSCFYIEGDETDSDIKLSFKDVERIVLAFFIQLINAKCIDYDDLSPELLRKISLYCLNRFGNSFKVPQLQTVIAKYSMIPNIKD